MKISVEHSGFLFEKEPIESIDKIQKHSGGIGSRALRMTMESNGKQKTEDSKQDNKVRDNYGYGSVNKPNGTGVAVDVNVYNEEDNLLGSRRSGDYCTWLYSFFI